MPGQSFLKVTSSSACLISFRTQYICQTINPNKTQNQSVRYIDNPRVYIEFNPEISTEAFTFQKCFPHYRQCTGSHLHLCVLRR